MGSPGKNAGTCVAQFKMKTRAYLCAAFFTVHTPTHSGYISSIVEQKHCSHAKRSWNPSAWCTRAVEYQTIFSATELEMHLNQENALGPQLIPFTHNPSSLQPSNNSSINNRLWRKMKKAQLGECKTEVKESCSDNKPCQICKLWNSGMCWVCFITAKMWGE